MSQQYMTYTCMCSRLWHWKIQQCNWSVVKNKNQGLLITLKDAGEFLTIMTYPVPFRFVNVGTLGPTHLKHKLCRSHNSNDERPSPRGPQVQYDQRSFPRWLEVKSLPRWSQVQDNQRLILPIRSEVMTMLNTGYYYTVHVHDQRSLPRRSRVIFCRCHYRDDLSAPDKRVHIMCSILTLPLCLKRP